MFQVHGAFLSGLREAGRIADYYLGFPKLSYNNAGDSNHQSNNKRN